MLPPHPDFPHSVRRFEDWLQNRYATQPGFDPSDLEPRLIPFFRNEVRIELGGGYFVPEPGELAVFRRLGTVSVSAGYKPVFLLVQSVRSKGGEPWPRNRFDAGVRVIRTKPLYGGNYKPFIESPRYLEIVAWYRLTLKIPRPINGVFK